MLVKFLIQKFAIPSTPGAFQLPGFTDIGLGLSSGYLGTFLVISIFGADPVAHGFKQQFLLCFVSFSQILLQNFSMSSMGGGSSTSIFFLSSSR